MKKNYWTTDFSLHDREKLASPTRLSVFVFPTVPPLSVSPQQSFRPARNGRQPGNTTIWKQHQQFWPEHHCMESILLRVKFIWSSTQRAQGRPKAMSEVQIEALLENTAELAICITIWDKNQSSGKTSCQVGKGKQERKEKTGKGWLGSRSSFAILSKQDTTTGNSEGNENATWVQMLLMGEKKLQQTKKL